MNRTDLEQAIVRELRAEAGQAPVAADLKRRLLELTDPDVGHDDSARRQDRRRMAGLRAWTVPLLAAAAAVLVALGLVAVTGVARRSHQLGPAVPSTTGVPQPTPTASGSPAPTARPSRTPERPTGAPADWFSTVNLNGLGSSLGCPGSSSTSTALDRKTVAVPGEPFPLGVAVVQCAMSPASRSQRVFVYRKASPRPVLVQVLGRPIGVELVSVQSVTIAPGSIRLAEYSRVSEGAPGFAFGQQFSWDASSRTFNGGDLLVNAAPCGRSSLLVAAAPLSTPSGDGVGELLTYRNTTAIPCTLSGYPTAVAVDAAGGTLARAAQVRSGFFGGLGANQAIPKTLLMGSVTASAIVEWSAASYSPTDVCVRADHLVISPPDGGASATAGRPNQFCQLQVHPLVAGSTGKQG